uniref:transient receptor potential cation channel subfamily M member 2-like isoform X5 n=1 Tax=Panthera onca TaxID=9690 RepID=UPI002952D835|nr:transient receptor potential cation channel subfamily M member 2-like isoform X5 [Panthera onca]
MLPRLAVWLCELGASTCWKIFPFGAVGSVPSIQKRVINTFRFRRRCLKLRGQVGTRTYRLASCILDIQAPGAGPAGLSWVFFQGQHHGGPAGNGKSEALRLHGAETGLPGGAGGPDVQSAALGHEGPEGRWLRLRGGHPRPGTPEGLRGAGPRAGRQTGGGGRGRHPPRERPAPPVPQLPRHPFPRAQREGALGDDRKDRGLVDPVGNALEPLSGISYNAVDGPIDRRSFHGVYVVQDGLPLNPMGRTGLRGRGSLGCFGPNHTLQPVITRWRRNQDGAICRKSIKKMLEVLVVKHSLSEHWALPGGSREPGEILPRKLKQVLRREFWSSFQNLLTQGTEVYRGYVDDPRNTDNAWIETVAISIHFSDQSDMDLKRLNSHLHACDPGMSVRWQVVDRRIPLYANHKTILQKVATLYGAFY